MGEESKFIGEYGEETVRIFLEKIGWQIFGTGIRISCSKSEQHKRKSAKGPRKTHGIDIFSIQESPLQDNSSKKIYISVKYSKNEYPNAPKSKFKEYFEDLTTAIECFPYTERHEQITRTARLKGPVENIGVLFWLSNNANSYSDLIERIQNVKVPDVGKYDQLIVVDNQRINFLFYCLDFLDKKSNIYNWAFFYPDTGKNMDPRFKNDHGEFLPVELLNANTIPFRLENKNSKETELIIFSAEPFEKEYFTRLVSFAQSLSKSWAKEVIIAFPNYNKLVHKEEEAAARVSFIGNTFIKTVRIISYKPNFTNLSD